MCSLDNSIKEGRILSLEEETICIIDHPGYKSVCLDTWVLDHWRIFKRSESHELITAPN